MFHHETLVLQFHGYINLIMNYTLIKMIQFWFIDKKLNPPFSTFLLRLTLPKTSHFLPCFLYIGNIKELFHNTAVLMIFMGNKFPSVWNILLVIELHIFCSSKKYLIWNVASAIRWEKSLFSNSLRSDLYRNFFSVFPLSFLWLFSFDFLWLFFKFAFSIAF